MPRHVVERFLQHAVDVHTGGAIHGKRFALLLIGYGNSRLPFYRRHVPVERALQSSLIEHDGMQGLREATNAFERGLNGLKDFLEIGAQGRSFRRMRARAPEHRTDSSKNLSKLVVQLARDVTQS